MLFLGLYLTAIYQGSTAIELLPVSGETMTITLQEPLVFRVALERDDYFRFRVDQVSAFVWVRVVSSSGETLTKSSPTFGYQGPFLLGFSAPEDGIYYVEVTATTSFDPKTLKRSENKKGQFKISVVDHLDAEANKKRQKELAKDPRVAYLKNSAIELTTIDPEHEDFSDLLPLKQEIGNARIVMLGEQTHGEGETMSAKIRLIKFLHREMGFDVLAFESSIFEVDVTRRQFEEKGSLSGFRQE